MRRPLVPVLAAALLGAALASPVEAGVAGRLRLLYIKPANPTFPDTQALNVGDKDRVGFGGATLGYKNPQLLEITRCIKVESQVDASLNPVSIFTTDDRSMLVPTNAGAAITTGNYGAAWTSDHSHGPYAVTVGEFAYANGACTGSATGPSSVVTVTVVPNAAFAREMGSGANGCILNCEVTNPDGGTGASFSTQKWQVATLLGTGSAICKGDTIYMRDAGPGSAGTGVYAKFNPHAQDTRIKPPANPWNCGAGSITITPENWDAGNDANGNPQLKNGFQFGGLMRIDPGTAGNIDFPLVFDHMWCMADFGSPAACFGFTTASGGGIGVTNTRCEGLADELTFTAGTTCLSSFRPDLTFSHNHIVLGGKALQSGGNTTAEWNICEKSRNDCIDIEKGGNTIRYNFGFDWHGVIPPCGAGCSNHSDMIQRISVHDGVTYTGNVIDYNINVLGDTTYMVASPFGADPPQNIFMRANTVPEEHDSAAEIKDDLYLGLSQNGLYLSFFDNPVVSGQGAISQLSSGLSGFPVKFVISAGEAGTGLTFTTSTFSSYGYTGQNAPYTLSPTSPIALPATSGAYLTALPNLVNGQTPGYKTRAQVIAQATPANTGAASGGLVNDGTGGGVTGTVNWPILPITNGGERCWNQPGLVFDPTKTCVQMGTSPAT